MIELSYIYSQIWDLRVMVNRLPSCVVLEENVPILTKNVDKKWWGHGLTGPSVPKLIVLCNTGS